MSTHHRHHDCAHSHTGFGKAFAAGIALNLSFVILEATYGFWAGSIALVADAGHNFSDVLGLLAAWGGAALSKASPTERFTYGFKGSSVLAALTNGVLLLVASGAVLLESAQRLVHPHPVAGSGITAVAAVGILVNGITALMLARGRKHDLNLRAAYVHMASDAAIAAAVVVAGGLILWTGQYWIDPLASIGVTLVVLWGTYGLLRQSIAMSLDAVPEHLNLPDVQRELESLEGVERVHDLHVWHIGTTETALTAHLFMPKGHPNDRFLHIAAGRMAERFHIGHSTFQVETSDEEECRLYEKKTG